VPARTRGRKSRARPIAPVGVMSVSPVARPATPKRRNAVIADEPRTFRDFLVADLGQREWQEGQGVQWGQVRFGHGGFQVGTLGAQAYSGRYLTR